MAVQPTSAFANLVDVPPALVARWLAERQAVLVDVREDFENAQECIADAEHCPLKALDVEGLRRRHGAAKVVFHCRTGRRSADAARRYARGDEAAFHLAGGIEAWKATGLPVQRSACAPRIDVMRQTQITIGTLVLLGILGGVVLTPWLLALAAFMGAGLVFAGASGTCGMARMLAKMPWNRPKPRG